MKTNEFDAWRSKNVKNVGQGGQRPSADPFNKSKKGFERNPQADEYPYKDIEGYHHYSERYSQKKTEDDDEKQENKQQSKESDSKSNQSKSRSSNSGNVANSAARQAARVAQNVIPRVVAVVAGSVVVVTGYQAVVEHEAQAKAAVTVTSTSWVWTEDNQNATIKLWNDAGELVKEITVVVEVAEETAPTCNKEGSRTLVATAEDGRETYSDTRTETLAPTGHSFDEGKAVVLENGQIGIEFECTHCHEKFTVTTSEEEE